MNASDKTKDGWTLQGEHEWDECSVQFSGSGCYHTIYEPGRRLPIAFVIGSSEYWRDSEAEDTARARLIAAAPDLLEAALAVEALWEGDRAAAKEAGLDFDEEQAWASPVGVIWKQLRAAISKATGDA
jgi:hypothetical protein